MSEQCSVPFSVRFNKDDAFNRSMPLSPFEYNAMCNCAIFDIPAHHHTHFEIMIAESDSAVHIINGEEYPAKENSVCLFLPYHVHQLKNDNHSVISAWYIDFDAGFLMAHIRDEKVIKKVFSIMNTAAPYLSCSQRDYSEIRSTMKSLVRSFENSNSNVANPIDQYLLTKLLERILEVCEKQQNITFCQEAHNEWWTARYLYEYFYKKISIKMVAKEVGTSVSSLNRFYVKRFGQTFSKTLSEIRMSHAGSLLLAYPRENIKHIAQKCGIDSEATFYRTFKDYYGMTPHMYRKIILKRFFNKTDDALPILLNHELLLDIYRRHNKKLTLSSFAQEKGLNPIQLREDFSRSMGESFARYVEDLRIIHAKNILSMSSLSVDTVGQLVGYDQVRSFIRAFIRKTGKTPTEYRKKFLDLYALSDNLPLS